MEQAFASRATEPVRAPIFKHILCGIDGSPSAFEAAAQAAALAAPDSRIELMAVSYERGRGPTAQALLSHQRAEKALHTAAKIVQKEGVEVVTTLRNAPYAARALIEAAAGHDLLVLAAHHTSRKAGIIVGGAVSRAVHESHVPVLVVREAPEGVPFPSRVLVGAGGPGEPEAAIAVAEQLERNSGSQLTLLRAKGDAHHELVAAAKRDKASLIIVGSRGLSGLHALSSTSERVAQEAPCSVLVLRH